MTVIYITINTETPWQIQAPALLKPPFRISRTNISFPMGVLLILVHHFSFLHISCAILLLPFKKFTFPTIMVNDQ